MKETINYYRIINTSSGVDLGVFGGRDEDEAIRLMLDEAGVADDEAADATVEALLMRAEDVSEDDRFSVEMLRERHNWTI